MIREKVLLVVVDGIQKGQWSVEETAKELKELIAGCRGEVIETVFCQLQRPSAAYLIGKGKVDEIAGVCSAGNIDTVIFSQDLKGSQQRNLEEVTGVKTIDRTQLILDIFARHASTQEGRMQVELAQLQYLLPRLVGKGIALSRLGGGIGTLGPGETKLEVDRRRISQRIIHLQRKLHEVSANRELKRKKRKEQGIPLVSLVGYTNAGKTTLLNQLTDAHQLTRDGLFTTLDSITRQYILPNHQKIIISDTVGFMHDLPHHLIESFKSTLEEVVQADLLLHVLDITQPNFRHLHDAVLSVLQELEAFDKPIITVLNKADALADKAWVGDLGSLIRNSIVISAKTGENISLLITKITDELSSRIVHVDVKIPITRMDLIHLVHKQGQVLSIKYYNEFIQVKAAVSTKLAGLLEKAQEN